MVDDPYINLIPKRDREQLLEALLHAYVDRQGLGGVTKTDFDALLVYLHTEYVLKSKFDAFEVSKVLRIKEARAKSLYETGLIKYGRLTEGKAWRDILIELAQTDYEVASYERGEITFRFTNSAIYRFFHARLRVVHGTAKHSSINESVTMNVETFLRLLDNVQSFAKKDFNSPEREQAAALFEVTVCRIGESLGKQKMKDLVSGEKSKTVFGQALSNGAKLAGIGSAVKTLLLVGAAV